MDEGRRKMFFSEAKRNGVFATMMAEFGNQTVMGLISVRELALRYKRTRTAHKAIGRRHHEWGFYGFCVNIFMSIRVICGH